jgi:cephalosporin hydroxylase
LSSTFPPPRPPAADRTLEKEMAALTNWQKQSIATASLGKYNPLCSSRHNKALMDKCEAMNVEVGKNLQVQAPWSSSFLTRKMSGYNLKDFNMVVGNDMITINQLSMGFEKILQGLRLHSASTFMGVSNQQDPSDAVVIGDMLWRVQPDLVIELGTSGGGSAFYYSHIMERYNPSARILTIDPAAGVHDGIPLRQWNDQLVQVHCPFCEHSTTTKEWRRDDSGRIRFHRGFPDSNEAVAIARAAAATAKTVLIIEDSNHEYESVRRNMHAYHELVTPGSYFLVQDTRLGAPIQAIRQFLESKNGTCFDIDKRWEYFLFSQHYDGFLRRRENCTTN